MYQKKIITIVLLSFYSFTANSQGKGILDQVREEEQANIEAIALYPEKERTAILVASTHPEILVRLQNMQARTATDFRKTIAQLSDEDQKKIFNLSRFPELLNEICKYGKKKSSREMEDILKSYPEDIHDQAVYLNKKHFDVLFDVNVLYNSSGDAFEKTLKEYPPEVQDAYRQLVKLPEIMSILTDNLNTTVLLGDMYRQDPDKLKAELDSLNVVVAEQKARELEEWKQSLEDDPEAMAEYERASKEFAQEQGYSERDYTGQIPARYSSDVYIHQMWQPYPYWFGCPWWLAYDCWYPYPWWYHWGYYYGPGNAVVFVGFPSSYFLYWHFYDPYHHYHYPHFTNQVIHYHQQHAGSVTPVTTVTENWIKDNNNNLPKNWLKDDGRRAERIREYGKFNMEYESVLREGNVNVPSRREYLEQNVKDYPTLKPVLKERPREAGEDFKMDPVKPQTTIKQPVEPRTEPKPKVIERPRTTPQVIDRAKQHHENTWQRPRPQIRRPVTRPPVRTPVQRPPVQRPPVRKIPPGKN